jgi:SM-20-related protein
MDADGAVETDRFGPLVAALAAQGWALSDDFLPPDAVTALADEAAALWSAGRFQAAAVGRGAQRKVRQEIRGDATLWLDDDTLTAAQSRYWEAMEALRREMNRSLFAGLSAFEAHYAVYPPGAAYETHVDAFAGSSERAVSCSLYLNPDWRAADGGELRLHTAGGHVDVVPRAGVFVVFRSQDVPHEVLPAARHRFSVTGWFRRRGAGIS